MAANRDVDRDRRGNHPDSQTADGRMELLLYIALIPTLAVCAQLTAQGTGLPGILLLLGFGMGLGHFINPDIYLAGEIGGEAESIPPLLFAIVSLSVAVIMFEGGLSLQFRELRTAGRATAMLCTVGVAITLVLASIAAHYLIDFPWRLAVLLGA
ncbi:MAG: cation:proton antiporter [Planctomycetota bacterium]